LLLEFLKPKITVTIFFVQVAVKSRALNAEAPVGRGVFTNNSKSESNSKRVAYLHNIITMDFQQPSLSSRKRGRATTPTHGGRSLLSSSAREGVGEHGGASGGGSTAVGGGGGVGSRLSSESTDDAIRAQQLRDKNQRIKALNSLLRLSTSHETNYALSGDSVLRELLNIAIYDCLSWPKGTVLLSSSSSSSRMSSDCSCNKQTSLQKSIVSDSDDETRSTNTITPVFTSSTAWIKPPTEHMEAWSQHCRVMLGGAGKRGEDCIFTTESSTPLVTIIMTREKFRILDAIVAILRNLSFVGANHRMLAYTPDVLALLVGCLYDDGTNEACCTGGDGLEDYNSASSNMPVNAMQTLIHLSSYLDVSGQKLLADKLFYSLSIAKDGPLVPTHASGAFGQAVGGSWGFGGMWLARRLDTKEDVVADVTKEFLLTMTADYLVGIWSLFSALAWILTNPLSPRPVLLMAVDLLQEFINHARIGVVGSVDLSENEDEIPPMRAILVNMPDAMLTRLVDFLYVPRLGPDALEYLDPVTNVVTRVTTLRLLMGYDATIDTDIRDRALEVLVPLLELDSPRMAARLGTERTNTKKASRACDGQKQVGAVISESINNFKPRMRLLDAIVPILKSSAGRNDAPLLASQLLRELSKAKENRVGLLCIQERLVELASNDNQRVSSVVWNHLYGSEGESETE
jgi:hypothetical protein